MQANDDQRTLRIRREGSVLTGVCSGLAAYFDVDVTLVRVAAVVLAIVSPWAGWAYVAAAFILPADEAESPSATKPFFDGQVLVRKIKAATKRMLHTPPRKNRRAFRRQCDSLWRDLHRAWRQAANL